MSQPAPDLMQRIAAARGGDPEAHEAVVHCVLPQIEAYVRLNAGELVRAHEGTADLVQTVCRQLISNLDGFRGSSAAQFRSWLSRLALHKIQMRHRFLTAQRRDVRREQFLETKNDSDDQRRLLTCYATFCTPSRDLSTREEVGRIEETMQKLPEDQRRVIAMACVIGLSYREIARELGKEEPAVRKLLSRARARLSLLLAIDSGED